MRNRRNRRYRCYRSDRRNRKFSYGRIAIRQCYDHVSRSRLRFYLRTKLCVLAFEFRIPLLQLLHVLTSFCAMLTAKSRHRNVNEKTRNKQPDRQSYREWCEPFYECHTTHNSLSKVTTYITFDARIWFRVYSLPFFVARKYERLSNAIVRSIDFTFTSLGALSGTGAKFITALTPASTTISNAS